MQTWRYIWRNMARNRIRSALTILSVGFSLALLTVLYGFMASQDAWSKDAAPHNRIVVMNIQGFSGKIPISSVDRVRSQDHVQAAVPYAWFGGKYQDLEMPFAQFATDPDFVFQVWPEFTIDAALLTAWQSNRRGCVCDRRLAEKFGWKIGERIPLEGTYYPVDLELELCGTFDSPRNTDSLWFNWTYLDESLRPQYEDAAGSAGTIFAKVDQASQVPPVIHSIDERFANSDNPTRTQTESAFAQMFVDMLGNVQDYIRNIGLAVVFSLSLVATNTMAMSVRERVTEISVLKALGFSRQRVLSMILGESTAIATIGGLIGTGLGCCFLTLMHYLLPQQFPFPIHEMAGPWIGLGPGVGAALGLISGLIPAIRASRLSVINGLRRVA